MVISEINGASSDRYTSIRMSSTSKTVATAVLSNASSVADAWSAASAASPVTSICKPGGMVEERWSRRKSTARSAEALANCAFKLTITNSAAPSGARSTGASSGLVAVLCTALTCGSAAGERRRSTIDRM